METQEKPKLKCKKRTVFWVDYYDFNSFVNDIYGIDYSFTASEESGNDTTHAFNKIDGKVDACDQEDLDLFKTNEKQSYMARILLNNLCKNGYIEPGDYLIKVSW